MPALLLGSIAGVFVDRWDRQRTMVVTNLLLALTLLPLLAVRSVDWIWLVYLVGFTQAVLEQFFRPAENALMPSLVSEEHLLAANSLNALNNKLARLLGPALGGSVFGLVGLRHAFPRSAAATAALSEPTTRRGGRVPPRCHVV